jgi:hypothetical protein
MLQTSKKDRINIELISAESLQERNDNITFASL